MVLSWLVRPPEEDSPLDVPSWLKWGSKDSSGCGAAVYLQRSKRTKHRVKGWCAKTTETSLMWGFKYTGGPVQRGG